jgi:hypothetical protein
MVEDGTYIKLRLVTLGLIKHSEAVAWSSLGSLSVPMYSLKNSNIFLIFGVRAFGLQYKAI